MWILFVFLHLFVYKYIHDHMQLELFETRLCIKRSQCSNSLSVFLQLAPSVI